MNKRSAPTDDVWDDTPSVAIIDAVSEAKGVDPASLTPLFKVINPDALNDLFSNRDDNLEAVTFRYEGFSIAIASDGSISLDSGQCTCDRHASQD